MNSIVQEDVNAFVKNFKDVFPLNGDSFLITGASGLIGSTLIHCLLALDKSITITAPVRNLEKAKQLFDESELENIKFIECDFIHFDYSNLGSIYYIFHCAAPTASKFFVEHPVETFSTIMDGTKKMLEVARDLSVKGMVYLSSLEVYGEIHDDTNAVTEEIQGYLDPMAVRSSYPMAKRASENLCCLYASEYGVPVMIARLTQTTGAGIAKDDNRIIAQFAKLASQGKDIVLNTTGESARPYCYTTDTISALLFILFKGVQGECYNVANESTYISARGMAEFIKEHINNNIQIKFNLDNSLGYAPPTKQKLSAQKLSLLGWQPQYDLKSIFDQLIKYIRAQ